MNNPAPRWHSQSSRPIGAIRTQPEDFVVEEIPAYEPSGEGEHLMLWVEKRGVAAEQLIRTIANSLGVRRDDVGYAGLKDRHAVTRQYLSVPRVVAEPRLVDFKHRGIEIIRAVPHKNKIRAGHLKGNQFSILVRTSAKVDDDLTAITNSIASRGFPNYFGTQRFGIEGETVALGYRLLRGESTAHDIEPARRKFLLRLALSAAQSDLFNRALAGRLQQGQLDTVHAGDVLQVVESGGVYVCDQPAADQPRVDCGEIVTTGPMFGPKMKETLGEPARWEQEVLQQSGLSLSQFTNWKHLTAGTRRPYVIRVPDLSLQAEPDGIRLNFTLPAGVYATTLLREMFEIDGEQELASDEET